jgi:hypothetical protein
MYYFKDVRGLLWSDWGVYILYFGIILWRVTAYQRIFYTYLNSSHRS